MKIDELKALMKNALTSKYYSSEEADKIIEVLVFAELTGKNTQGILKLLGPAPAQDIKPKYKPKFTKETALSAVLDGGGAAGPLPSQIATDKVIELCKNKGFGMVGMNNTFSSVGAISFYANRIAKKGFIGVVAANCPRGVIHFGSIEPIYGTNPLAFGFPTKEYPIVLDIASSAITWYGLVRAKAMGHKLPNNVAIDRDGKITTDPEVAMKGAVLPFDRSYKGSGLAMVVELIAGVFTGASFVFDEGDWGTVFISIDPELTIGREEFKKRSLELVRKVKAGKTKEGSTIHIPGFDTEKKMRKIIKSGNITIDDKIIIQLKKKLING